MSEFLAEAAVLVRANTEAFRAKLLADVESAVAAASKLAVVSITPVVAAPAKSAASAAAVTGATETAAATKIATIAVKEETAADTEAAAAKKAHAAFTRQAAIAETAYGAAAQKTSVAVSAGATAVSATATARAKYTAAIRSNLAADIAWREALKTGNADLIKQNAALFARTVELKASAAAELKNAEATAVAADASNARATALSREAKADAARSALAARGAAATALSAAGARGATLAASGPFLAGAAAAVALGKSIQIAAQFNRELQVLQVTAGATAEQMGAVGDEARRLGRDVSLPAVSAVDAAQAMTELSKAGLSVEDSIAGARGVLQLAAAAQIDNASATELAASALNAFGLAGDQAVHVADVLTNAANDAQGSISDMGASLQQAAAVGRQAGLTLEQTTAILTIFARNGLRGSDAGTSFRTMLIRLINPTQKAAELMKKLGLNLRDANGAIRLDVFDQFTEATKRFTKAERDRALAIIFGQDAIRGASIAAREGTAAINAEVDSLNKAGAAAQLAGARAKGLAGEASALQSNLETLALTTGNVLSPALEHLVRTLNLAVSGLNVGTDAIGRFFGALAGAGEFDATNANFGELTTQLAKAQEDLRKFRESGGKQAPGLESDIADLAKRIRDISAALNEVGPAGLQKMLAGFKSASPQIQKSLQDGVITPLEKAQLSSSALGKAFVASLPKRFFVGLGADARSGIEDAVSQAKQGVQDLGPEIASGIEDQSREAVTGARNFGNTVGNALKDGIKTAFFGAVAAANAGAQALNDAMNQAVIAGAGPQQIIPILNKEFANQQKKIDAANARLAELGTTDTSDVAKKARARAKAERSAAFAEQAKITGDIKAQQDQIASAAQKAASDREQKARDAQQAITKSDQKVLDSFTGGQNRIDLASISANASVRISDDIALQNLIIKTAEREKQIIEDTVKDQQTKNAQIAERVKTIKAATAERDRLILEAAKAATEKRQKAADALTESLGKAITLAGLRENDKAEIAAINKAIANAKFRIRNYKKLGLNLQDEKIALETLINQRDEVNNTAKDAKDGGGTTAFDLLKEFADTFNQNAGNLINQNQPFAGPTGFTADIAQFLVRRPGAQAPSTAKADFTAPLVSSNADLIRVIVDLTDTIRSGGSKGTSTGVNAPVKQWSRGSFAFARDTRDAVEARSGV